MKSKITLFLLIISSLHLYGQKKQTYGQKSAELKKNIWDSKNSIFESNTIPEKFNNESAVIIARNYELQRLSNTKLRIGLSLMPHGVNQTNRTTIFREKIKINDKASLEDFSKLEYQKFINKSESYLLSKIKNSKEVYIGIKIIKPDGKEIIVNSDEEVLLANSDKNQKAKLAIPGLQVGDIIDYFICTIRIFEGKEEENGDDYISLLVDEYPVLNYNYVFRYGKNDAISCINANGAQKFVQSTNADQDQVYTLQGENMPKYKDELWSSPLRSLPYFAISCRFKTPLMGTFPHERYDPSISMLDNYLDNYGKTFHALMFPYNNYPQRKSEENFSSLKKLKALPLDSTMSFFYNIWKNGIFCSYDSEDSDMGNQRNYRTATSKRNSSVVCQMLCEMEISHDLLITTSKFSNTLDNVVDADDFNVLVRINASKPLYMAFDKVNTNFNEIPYYYQGEKALVLTPKRHSQTRYSFTRSETVLPISEAKDNKTLETIGVNFMPADMQILNIKRNVKQSGFMRLSDQLNLLLIEDINKELSGIIGKKDLITELGSDRKSKKMIDGYNIAIADARKEVKKHFTEEITNQFGQTPKTISDFKVINSGINSKKPIFEYEASFTLENLVKKAGNNYILEIGKLIGELTRIEADKRIRETNIFMPAARTLSYQINLELPGGYNIKGLNDLSITKTNELGSFISTSKIDGKKLTINVDRIYANASLPKEKWVEIMELLNIASDFNEKKILLEKIN